jgi:hypothetical protein
MKASFALYLTHSTPCEDAYADTCSSGTVSPPVCRRNKPRQLNAEPRIYSWPNNYLPGPFKRVRGIISCTLLGSPSQPTVHSIRLTTILAHDDSLTALSEVLLPDAFGPLRPGCLQDLFSLRERTINKTEALTPATSLSSCLCCKSALCVWSRGIPT